MTMTRCRLSSNKETRLLTSNKVLHEAAYLRRTVIGIRNFLQFLVAPMKYRNLLENVLQFLLPNYQSPT